MNTRARGMAAAAVLGSCMAVAVVRAQGPAGNEALRQRALERLLGGVGPTQKVDLKSAEEAWHALPPRDKVKVLDTLEASGFGVPPALEQLVREGKVLPPKRDDRIFRVIKNELRPRLLSRGEVVDVLEPSAHPWGRPLDAAEKARLVAAASSVGRIEVRAAGSPRRALAGTGFVAGTDLVATNCHVLSDIIERRDGAWVLKPGLSVSVDFGEATDQPAADAYAVIGVAAVPPTPYLDVGLLRVAPLSASSRRPLPAKLPWVEARPARPWTVQEPRLVAVVGYPDLTSPCCDQETRQMFRSLREQGGTGNQPKLLALGAVTAIDARNGIDFLDHVVSTHPGQSGSPLLDRATAEVVGVHYCCRRAAVPATTADLACSSGALSDLESNEAVSAWAAAADGALQALLKPPGAVPVP